MSHLIKLSLPALAASLLLAACGSSSSSTTKTASNAASTSPAQTVSGSGVVVHTISSPTLGPVLVDPQGMTLYHLTGESANHFICSSSACAAIWHPLIVTSGAPTGTSSLSVVKRPDGTVQAAYKGEPLYTFVQDHKSGETNGQGVKDVGTWTVVTVPASTASGSGGSSSGSGESSSSSGSGSGGESSESSSSGGKSYGY
jgi:predicted lipoprotein with Yx(FWY)xxD motif